jgi:bilirubin oxidase
MLAMFNVSFLADFNYTETTHFIDPMEQRYRAKPILNNDFASVETWGTGEFSLQGVTDKVNWFASLDAYKNVEDIEAALEQYWGRTTLVRAGVANPTVTPKPSGSPNAATPSGTTTKCKRASGSGKGGGNC